MIYTFRHFVIESHFHIFRKFLRVMIATESNNREKCKQFTRNLEHVINYYEKKIRLQSRHLKLYCSNRIKY
jgi:hypothetical protein